MWSGAGPAPRYFYPSAESLGCFALFLLQEGIEDGAVVFLLGNKMDTTGRETRSVPKVEGERLAKVCHCALLLHLLYSSSLQLWPGLVESSSWSHVPVWYLPSLWYKHVLMFLWYLLCLLPCRLYLCACCYLYPLIPGGPVWKGTNRVSELFPIFWTLHYKGKAVHLSQRDGVSS